MSGFGVDRSGSSSSGASASPIPESIIDAKGDLIAGTADDTAGRVAVGSDNQRLVADSAQAAGLKWVGDTQNTVADAKGDLIVGTAADTVARLAVGTNEQRLVADSAQATGLKYVADTTNYAVAAKGDILVGTAADTVAPVPVGTSDGMILQVDSAQSTGVSWVKRQWRNRIINGAMEIDQANAGGSVTVNSAAVAYGVDGWNGFGTGSAGVFTMQRASATPPTGYKNYTRITTTTADATPASGSQYLFQQRIEGSNMVDLGFGASGAQSVTISFRVRSSLTGTFSGALKNGGSDRSYPFTYAINAANTWETKIITIAGDTSGTWPQDTTQWGSVTFDLGCGSTTRGTAGAWTGSNINGVTNAVRVISTLSATWDITGIQPEPGSVATEFERRPIAVETMLCQRYYWKGAGTKTLNGTASSINVSSYTKFPTTMRASPTVTVSTGAADSSDADHVVSFQNSVAAGTYYNPGTITADARL